MGILALFAVVLAVYLTVANRNEGVTVASSAVQGGSKVPEATWVLASGTGEGLVQAYCSACHSLAPIVTHSGFTKAQWAAEVTKMRKNYGAPIDDATAKQITAYLQATYATNTTKPKGTSELLYNDPAKR